MSVYKLAGQCGTEGRKVVDVSSMPEHWERRLVDRGFTDRRSAKGGASISALAEKCGLGVTTVSNAIFGRTETSPTVIKALVDELGEDVARWLGVTYGGEWKPPAAAVLLTDRQRDAIDFLILAMTEQRQETNDGAPMSVTPLPAPRPASEPGRKAAQRRRSTRGESDWSGS